MIEYEDPRSGGGARAAQGHRGPIWVRVEGCARVYAIADEDLERENEEKTSSVHFLRFELGEAAAQALKRGAALSLGADHPEYRASARAAARGP